MDTYNLPDYESPEMIKESSTILQLRSMNVMARFDPGMKDLLDRVKEYYALKGSPSLREVIQQEKEIIFRETL